MALVNRKNIKRSSGFTIVELLIVIVVIAILATISIVAYTGVQNRAKASAGKELASQVLKKMEALNAIKGVYTVDTATTTFGANLNTVADAAPEAPEAKLDKPTSVIRAASATGSGLSASTAANGTVVSAWACAGGADVWYWDYAASAPAAVEMTAGAGC